MYWAQLYQRHKCFGEIALWIKFPNQWNKSGIFNRQWTFENR